MKFIKNKIHPISRMYFRDFVVYTLVSIISVILISSILNTSFKRTLNKSAGTAYQHLLTQTASYIDNNVLLHSQQFIANNIASNNTQSNFNAFLCLKQMDMTTIKNAYESLQLTCNNYPSFDSVIIYNKDINVAISSETGSYFAESNDQLCDFFNKHVADSISVWISDNDTKDIFHNKRIFSLAIRKDNSYVLLNFDEEDSIAQTTGVPFEVTDTQGNTIINSNLTDADENHLTFHLGSKVSNWKYTIYVPHNMYYSEIDKTSRQVAIYVVFVVLLLIVSMYFIVSYINAPLKRLINKFTGEDLSCYQLFELMSKKIENLQEMLDEFNSQAETQAMPLEERMSKGLMQIIQDYISNNIDRNISLSKVARHFGITEAHLSRAFKKEFNIGFLQYLTNAKMEKAAQMLTDPQNKLSIKEIADYLGYTVQTFNSNFKKKYSVPPSQYRTYVLLKGQSEEQSLK